MLWILTMGQSLHAQVYLSRYIGGDYLQDAVYQIELFNTGTRAVDISGYMLISRQYVALLPSGTRIQAQASFRLGKQSMKGAGLSFEEIADFIIRIPSRQERGDYLLLLDRRKRWVDGFYYSPVSRVDFLPDKGELITYDRRKIPFEAPAEQDPRWGTLRLAPDPAMAFVQIGKQWHAVSRSRNTLPATAYGDISARYIEGIVTVEAEIAYERDCLDHLVERSSDGKRYRQVGSLKSEGNSRQPRRMRFYDHTVAADDRYYYRITNRDRFGYIVHSRIAEARTTTQAEDFHMESFVTGEGRLGLRFSAKAAPEVYVKLLDERFREYESVRYRAVKPGSRYLIYFDARLPRGRYLVIADTGSRRYYREVMVGE